MDASSKAAFGPVRHRMITWIFPAPAASSSSSGSASRRPPASAQAKPSTASPIIFDRDHWRIENGCHYILNVHWNWYEGRCTIRTGHRPENITAPSGFAIGVIRSKSQDTVAATNPVAGAERPPGLVLPSQEGQFPLSPASPPREGLLERIRRVYCRLGMATRVPVFPARCPSRWVAAGTTEPEFRRLAGTRSSAPYVPPRIPLRFSRCGGLGGVEYSRDCTPNPGRRQIVAMGRDFAEAGFSFEVSERTRDSPSKP